MLVSLDGVTYAVERVLLLISVVMMTVLVFVDVLQRTFSRPVGKTADFMLWTLKLFADPSPETVASIQGQGAEIVFGVGSLLFLIAGTQSARNFKLRRTEPGAQAPFALSIGIGAVLFLLGWGSIQFLLYLAPQGIPGAQKFALGFLVWSGFIGASLAVRARRHILLDAVKKKLGPEVGPLYGFIGGLLTFLFCAFISFMGYSKSFVEIGEWSESDHAIHVFEALPIPTWVVTLAIPVFLTIAAVRFLFAGLSELLYGAPLSTGADEHGIDFDELEQQAAGVGERGEEAPPPGWVLGRPHDDTGAANIGRGG